MGLGQSQHKRSRISTIASAALVLLLCLAASTAAAAETPLVAGAKCSKSRSKAVKRCLNEIYAQEEALPNGPCYSEDWECVCRMQQGILDCWQDAGCADAQPKSQVQWNDANCAGQHGGFKNRAAGGDLVFDLSKVASASGLDPTPTGKHKHHKSTDDDDDVVVASSTTAAAATPSLSSGAGSAPGPLTSVNDYAGLSILSVNPSHSYGGPATAVASFTAAPIITSAASSSFANGSQMAVVLFSSVAVAALLGSLGL